MNIPCIIERSQYSVFLSVVQTVIEFSVAKSMTQKEKGILSNFHLQWMVRLSMLAKDFTFHTLNDKVYDQ